MTRTLATALLGEPNQEIALLSERVILNGETVRTYRHRLITIRAITTPLSAQGIKAFATALNVILANWLYDH